MAIKILFVSHEASRTGAPIVFKHLLSWIKAETDIEITLLLRRGGDLEDDFREITPFYIWSPVTMQDRLFGRACSKLSDLIRKKKIYKRFPRKLGKETFDLIYLNTVASYDLAEPLKNRFDCPVILHVHENEHTIQNSYLKAFEQPTRSLINHYIAVSESTRNNLINKHGIPADAISLVYEFVKVNEFSKPAVPPIVVKKELNLKDEFIIGGCGPTGWRKGVDLFVQLAAVMSKKYPAIPVKLIWVGGINNEFYGEFKYEEERLGIAEKVIFTGSVTTPQNYFQLFDVFALTSREDPFPLVCIEAAALSKPIICFDKSGGIPELLSSGGGYAVRYGDVEEMADKVSYLYNNRQETKIMGEHLKREVPKYDVEVGASDILKIITKTIRLQ